MKEFVEISKKKDEEKDEEKDPTDRNSDIPPISKRPEITTNSCTAPVGDQMEGIWRWSSLLARL